mmetsp:Transcript_87993/g.247262  ORF Transcript_87993/g.247262 Transcript_87993/m.247262 type:complete len:280 (+) Transcript_87993:108-947(+)
MSQNAEGSWNEHDPQLDRTSGRNSSKWWHVPDGQIEDLVNRLGANQTTKPAGALRGSRFASPASTCTATKLRTVRFSGLETDLEGDALDRAMRQSVSNGAMALQRKNGKRTWQVSDDRISEFVQQIAARAEANEECGTAPTGAGRLAPAGRLVMGATGGRPGAGHFVPPDTAQRIRDIPICTRKGLLSGRHPSNATSAGSLRRGGRSRDDSSSRPTWNSNSTPNLFAPVGIGLDGKGNKVIKPGVEPFANTSIYLADVQDVRLSRVREAVSGHASYMRR